MGWGMGVGEMGRRQMGEVDEDGGLGVGDGCRGVGWGT